MSRPAYRFAPAADEDLTDIWLYSYATWGEDQADRYIEALHACCERIAAGDAATRPVFNLDCIHTHHCRHHVLFFTTEGDEIVILAILHERMDLIERLRDRL